MKRILALGALALSLTLASEQQASAWINFKFGVGLNYHWQSGGNNWLWGAFNNGQVPGPEYFGAPGYGGAGYGSGYDAPHGHGHAYTMPAMSPSYAFTPTYTAPQPSPYHYASYGYYTMPAYYYPMNFYGR